MGWLSASQKRIRTWTPLKAGRNFCSTCTTRCSTTSTRTSSSSGSRSAFAIFALTEKQVISLDVAATLILLIAFWLLANLLDASYWYNRNLAIITHIEQEFLEAGDLKSIHYYFGKHRPNNKMITHLRIQAVLGIGVTILILAWHFSERVLPGIRSASQPEPIRALPYIAVAIALILLVRLRHALDRKYKEFLENSPGKPIDTEGIRYGEGHGFPSQPRR